MQQWRLLTRQAGWKSRHNISRSSCNSFLPGLPGRSAPQRALAPQTGAGGRGIPSPCAPSPAPQEQQAPPSLFLVAFLLCLFRRRLGGGRVLFLSSTLAGGSLSWDQRSEPSQDAAAGRGSEGTGNPRPPAQGWGQRARRLPWLAGQEGVSLSA